jgi:hypothetical protein
MRNDRCGGAAVPFLGSVCAGIITLLAGGAANADTLRVPSQYPTIQEAILASSDGDEVLVAPGTYDGPVRFWGKAITLRGVTNSEAGPPTIQATTAVVRFIDGETLASTIDNFNIIGGNGPYGGGVKISDSFATIRNCTAQGQATIRGGAISVNFGGAYIYNSIMLGISQGDGGGLSVFGSTVELRECQIDGIAGNGACISVENSTLTCELLELGTINGVPILGATADTFGGGIYARNSTLALRDVNFTTCTAGNAGELEAAGGGLALLNSSVPLMQDCTFGNCGVTALDFARGGAIYSDGAGTNPTPTNCLFAGCAAVSAGGDADGDGIPETDGTAMGGAICLDEGNLQLVSCGFFANQAATAAEVAVDTDGNDCPFPNGVAMGGNIKLDGDLLVQNSSFHNFPPPTGDFFQGGNATGSLVAQGGCIHAGMGNVVMYDTNMNDCNATGAVLVPLEPSGDDDPDPCEDYHWEGEASGGGIWTMGRVSLYTCKIGLQTFQLGAGPGPTTPQGCTVTAYPDTSGGAIFALGGVDLINKTGLEGDESQVWQGITTSTDENARFFDEDPLPRQPLGGGGIYVGSESDIIINGAIVSGCESYHGGGGMLCGALTAENAVITNNLTGAEALGVELNQDGEPVVDAGHGGGALVFGTGKLAGAGVTLINSDLIGNSTFGDQYRTDLLDPETAVLGGGGGIFTDGSVIVSDSEVTSNTGSRGGGIRCLGDLTASNIIAVANNGVHRLFPESPDSLDAQGGVFSSEGAMIVTNSTFEGNGVSNFFGAGLGGALHSATSVDASDSCGFRKNFVTGVPSNLDFSSAGGAIHSSSVSVSDSSFYLNTSDGSTDDPERLPCGGSIACEGGLSLANCDFRRDFSSNGGAVWVKGRNTEDMTIDTCSFRNLNATGAGGAVDASSLGTINIVDTDFDDNTAGEVGGGLHVLNVGSMVLTTNNFRRNTCLLGNGGGVALENITDNYLISGCSFGANVAAAPDGLGGGGYLTPAAGQVITLRTSVVAGNDAGDSGGGFYVLGDGELRISDNFFCDNTPNNYNDDEGNIFDDGGNAFEEGGVDCNENGICDTADLLAGLSGDCNANDVPDECDIASGTSSDTDGNGVPDECVPGDCDNDGIPDSEEIGSGKEQDCNGNNVPDSCDIADGTSDDCNNNGVPDSCDIEEGGASQDCNNNNTPDECDIADGFSEDCNNNGIPDECDLSEGGASEDCNDNGFPDECDIADGFSEDCNENSIPDECEVANGTVADCNDNNIPDDCDINSDASLDCNGNKVPDECDVASGFSEDCNGNNAPDDCDIADGTVEDCNLNDIPDQCDLADGTVEDCNENLVPDECDVLVGGGSSDQDSNGIPDECECIGDVNFDGLVNGADLSALLGSWGDSAFDLNGDDIVDGLDLSILLGTWGICP